MIELDGGFDGTGLRFMGIEGFQFEKHLHKTFYRSSLGTAKIYLNPKKPLNGDTLFVLWREYNGFDIKFEKLDTVLETRSGLWKTYRNKPGGSADIHFGR